jgi:hypothetical protein
MSGHRLIWFCADSVAVDLKRITGQKGITTNPSIDSAGGYALTRTKLQAILGLSGMKCQERWCLERINGRRLKARPNQS